MDDGSCRAASVWGYTSKPFPLIPQVLFSALNVQSLVRFLWLSRAAAHASDSVACGAVGICGPAGSARGSKGLQGALNQRRRVADSVARAWTLTACVRWAGSVTGM